MTTVQRLVLRVLIATLIAALAHLVVIGTRAGWRVITEVFLQLMPFGILAIMILVLAQRMHLTRQGAKFRIAINDGHLRMYKPGWHGKQLVDVDLENVRHIHWYISPFSRKNTVQITLWDRTSTFSFHGIDIWADDPDANDLGWFRSPDLLRQTEQHRRLIEYFQPLVLSGKVTSGIDLTTLEPT